MKTSLLLASSLTLNASAQVLPPEQLAHYQLVCQEALKTHEQRLFDALANHDLLDWTLIKADQQTSRVNYTRTVEAFEHRNIHCDAVIQYQYDDKNVVVKTTYIIDSNRHNVHSELRDLNAAVHDFLVQLMV
ncbi:hypothetical protein [Vibrio methylphosphonaticus]|uniref:hypothetical protein n=1 Tax=Vibrio methylphosphonaticus TaxID=2946866 RepID=UPI00202A3050|nr:hypothetical protein [Vibrio methylphosphonaticus]MCL9776768.1 hypothetical protein [Vibrio methylphosphonaticus]